jgi:hypothetical protein
MISWIRRRLTYANVVSTICLFIVLGGTAYAGASSLINGAKIKDHTIAGKKLKNDTLGGGQINESSLGKVRSATHADTATSATSANAANSAATANTANSANTAATATHALTADTASTANSATNALALGGLDSNAFERSSRTQFGYARDDVNGQVTLLSWPQLGVEVRTDGDTDTANQLIIRNTRNSGNIIGTLNGTAFGPGPGTETGQLSCPPGLGAFCEGYVLAVDDPSAVLHIQCFFEPVGGLYHVFCFGTRSRPQ